MGDRAGISDGFVYAPKPAAAPAANIRVSLPPHNKDNFKDGNETIMFNIPCGKRGQYLNTRMSYLTFDFEVELKKPDAPGGTNTSTTPLVYLEGGAHGFIQHLELYHGTNLLEQIREYGNLYQLHLDKTEVMDAVAYSRSVTEGTGGCIISPVNCPLESIHYHRRPTRAFKKTPIAGAIYEPGTGTETGTGGAASKVVHPYGYGWHPNGNLDGTAPYAPRCVAVNSMAEARAITAGDHGVDSSLGVVFDRKVTYTFAIPLMSGIIGGGMGKYIPVGALQSDLRLELGLASWHQALRTFAVMIGNADSTTFTMSTVLEDVYKSRSVPLRNSHNFNLTNVELQLEYVEVASDVQSAIEASTGGQYVMSFDSHFNIQNAVPAGTSSFTQLIGAKFSSVKTILSTFRDGFAQNQHHLSGLSRLNPFSTTPNRPEFYQHHYAPNYETKYANGSGWYYSIGATHYPNKPIRSDEETFYEALKSSHLVAVQNAPGQITKNTWRVSALRDSVTAANSISSMAPFEHPQPGGTFYLGMNFESQSHKSQLAESGVNTLAQNMYIHCQFPGVVKPYKQAWKLGVVAADDNGNVAGTDFTYVPIKFHKAGSQTATTEVAAEWQLTNQQMTIDHYVHYDGLLIIVNGIANTRF